MSEQISSPTAPVVKPPRARVSRAQVDPDELLARKGRTHSGRETGPIARYAGLALTPSRQINGRSYQVLSARTIPRERYNTAFGRLEFEEGDQRVFAFQGEGWSELITHAEHQGLLINANNGRLVVVTGGLNVAVDSGEVARELARDEGLELITYKENSHLAFFRAPPGYRLLPAVERVRARAGVRDVNLGLFESKKVAR